MEGECMRNPYLKQGGGFVWMRGYGCGWEKLMGGGGVSKD